jgi:hypothetical protein
MEAVMVGRKLAGASASAAALAGLVGAREARRRHRQARGERRWLAVTVNVPPETLSAESRYPEPLERIRDRIEVRTGAAPGGRGTELAARLVPPPRSAATSFPARLAGLDPRQELRDALRETKSLLEAGEVMLPDTPPTTRKTAAGMLLGLVGRRSGGEGVL